MTISVMQPHFMPYPGLFDLIANVDKFIFYLDVKFERSSWQTRNRIKEARGWQWLTVPVKDACKTQLIKDIKIDYDQDWIKKHLKTLTFNYSKAPFFDKYFPEIKNIYNRKQTNLCMLNIEFTRYFIQCLQIDTRVACSVQDDLDGLKRNEKLFSLCHQFKADTYLSSVGGRPLYTEKEFKDNGINLIWQDYPEYRYPQLHKPFIAELSILDLLFNCGPESKKYIYAKTNIS